jgi:hypothetical protein
LWRPATNDKTPAREIGRAVPGGNQPFAEYGKQAASAVLNDLAKKPWPSIAALSPTASHRISDRQRARIEAEDRREYALGWTTNGFRDLVSNAIA